MNGTTPIAEWRKRAAEEGRLGDALLGIVPDQNADPVEEVREMRRTGTYRIEEDDDAR
jgi:hypothetical protein